MMKQNQIQIAQKKVFVSSVCGLLLLCLSACSTTPHQAPVVERSHETNKEPAAVVVETPAPKAVVDTRPTYTVKRGDTLLRIAFELGLNYRDIVAWNNLSNPNDIKVDQVLFVAAPNDTQGASKTSPVISNSSIEVRNLNPINPSTHKTAPRGDKRVYSEANLAELQKSEVAPTSSVNGAKTEPSSANNKAVEKPADKVPEKAPSETLEWGWPTEGKVVANFDDVRVKGIQIAGKSGQDIYASAPGKVIYEGNAMRGYGNIVIIKHANNYLTAYAYNKTNVVREGQPVSKGQKIAEMGNTDTDSVKLHFEIRQAGKPVDPLKLLPAR